MMVGALGAGLIERQVRRALAELQHPIIGLMPEGRDTLHPTVARLFKVFADYSLVQVKDAQGRVVETRFARLHPVQAHILRSFLRSLCWPEHTLERRVPGVSIAL